jgi:hypothetical protein
MKNRIINGAMVIDQRNNGAAVNPAVEGNYTLDRWRTYSTPASKYSLQQNQGSVTPPAGFSNYLGVTSLSSYSIGSTDYQAQLQFIEGFNTADLNWGTANAKTVTLSAWVRSSLTGTFGGAIQNATFDRSYPFTYTISSANTWTQISVTIAGDTSGTWVGATNGKGMTVFFGLGVGSTYSGTAGTWASSNYLSATGAVSVVGTSGATWYVTGVQLEVGSNVTGYEYRLYNQELSACQRYYQQIVGNTSGGFAGAVLDVAKQIAFGQCSFKVTMRTSPTVILYDGNGVSGTVTQVGSADAIPATANGINVNGFTQASKTTSTFVSTYGYPVVSGFVATAEF